MLGNIVLVVLQFAAAFLGAPIVMQYVPVSGDLRTFAHAGAFALIIWVVGLLASLVLKGVMRRSPAALALSLALAMCGAAIVEFAPQIIHALPIKIPQLYVPLLLALTGYFLRR